MHHVFVDFENVPSVDLTAIADLPVLVTLLIGGVQNKLDTSFVEQIHAHAAKVRLVKLAASGRNALDLTLAYYLGRTVAEHGAAELHIVSKDKDFEPLIAHLRAKNVKITRSDSFAALPFLPTRKPVPAVRVLTAPRERRAPQKKPVEAKQPLLPDRITKVAARLENPHGRNRPSTERALRAHLRNALGKESSDAKVETLLEQLQARNVLAIDGRGKVIYSHT